MSYVYANNVESTLSGAVLVGATQFNIQLSDVSKVPDLSGNNYTYFTFSDGTTNEVVKITGFSGGSTFTCEATTMAWADATSVAMLWCSEALDDIIVVNHSDLPDVGINSHVQIDSHIASSTIHFTEGSINHTAISNVGTNTHAQIDTHIASSINPHNVTQAQVGLGNVDNTSDASKPVSTAQQTALDLKAPLASPALTGTPTAPTATLGTNTTQIATTAFVLANAGGGGAGIWSSDTPPVDKSTYPIWFNTATGLTFTWYEDGTSDQWVQDDTVFTTSSLSDNSVTASKLVDTYVQSDTTEAGSSQVVNCVFISQANYDLLTPDSSTLYIITG